MPPDSTHITNDAVLLKTGRSWEDWFNVLDGAGAKAMKHKDISTLLMTEHTVNAWWAQMITTHFERARGLREKYQRADGRFQGSVSRTFEIGDDVLFRFWTRDEERARWLPDAVDITEAVPVKSVRLIMSADQTRVDVYLLSTGEGRCRLTINHGKLPDSAAVEARKTFWKERLEVLRGLVEYPAEG
jgi:hypothetical protein